MTATDYSDQNLYNLFAEQVRRRPRAIALIAPDGEFTYLDLARRACEICDVITGRLREDEELVGVLLQRDSDLIAGLLGILKSGAAYFPLDASDPPSRNAMLLREAGCRLVVGTPDLTDPIADALSSDLDRILGAKPRGTVDFLDVRPFRNESRSETEIVRATADGDGDRLAYVLYTSGSTGKPKGVEITHRNMIHLLVSSRDLLGFRESDRSLVTGSIGFDITVPEIYLPLITGGSVVLRDQQLVLQPRRLAEEIRRFGVTMFHTGPSVWAVILAEIPDFPKLRIMSTTGDAVRPEFASHLVDRADSVWNLYGPTETTVWACGHLLSGEQTDTGVHSTVSAPVGKPLAHLDFLVVDERLAPVQDGERGELLIGGPSLARGYRSRPDLTAEKFIRMADGNRYYRTGDVVIRDRNGTVHYFGRNDDQLSIRGLRIEPREVESAIESHASVREVAATWYQASENARAIVAAVVLENGVNVPVAELHRHTASRMPKGMVPSRFLFVPEIPITENRKVDRKAIRAQVDKIVSSGGGDSLPPPREVVLAAGSSVFSATEAIVADIWKQVLGTGPREPDDQFFAIGGDSLSAVSVAMQIERRFDISIPVQILFEFPRVRELAAKIELLQLAPTDLDVEDFVYPLVSEGKGTPVFFCHVDLKMARRGLWNLDCPLYAISLWARGHGFATEHSVEELAAAHIRRVRAIQPAGPYRLAGYSFGAIVAMEMARQLTERGDVVELLFMLDPSEPYHIPSDYPAANAGQDSSVHDERGIFESRSTWMARHLGTIVRRPWSLLSYVGARWSGLPFWGWLCYRAIDLYGKFPNGATARLLPGNRWPAFRFVLKRLARSYETNPYSGRTAALFSSRNGRWEGWKKLLPRNTSYEFVDSRHSDMFSSPARSVWLQQLSDNLNSESAAKPRPSRPAGASASR